MSPIVSISCRLRTVEESHEAGVNSTCTEQTIHPCSDPPGVDSDHMHILFQCKHTQEWDILNEKQESGTEHEKQDLNYQNRSLITPNVTCRFLI